MELDQHMLYKAVITYNAKQCTQKSKLKVTLLLWGMLQV